MAITVDVAYKSLNKFNEVLCGDKVELLKTEDSNIMILADGMGSGVKANILATLTSKILGTMFLNGATLEECVETIVETLPICKVRQVAYSTFSILQVFHSGAAYLVEFDNPSCIFIRNGKLVPIEYVIQNGDRIEVITSQNSKGPSRDWLALVKSTQAKNKINQWFKSELKEDNIVRGKDLIDRYCKTKGINFGDLNKPEFQEKVMQRYAFRDWDSVLASIGHGGLKEGQVINKMIEEREKKTRKEVTDTNILDGLSEMSGNKAEVSKKSKGGIMVKGIHDVAVRFSRCCSPVPGDEIVGYVTRGRGVSIHRTDCVNIINLPSEERTRLIEAEWQQPEDDSSTKERYTTEIQIYANNRIGMFVDISKVFTERQIDITSMNVRTSKQGKATIIMTFDIHGIEELNRLTDKLRQIDGVIDIERTAG